MFIYYLTVGGENMIKLNKILYNFEITDLIKNLRYNYHLDYEIYSKIAYYVAYKALTNSGYVVDDIESTSYDVELLLANSKYEFRSDVKHHIDNVDSKLRKLLLLNNVDYLNNFTFEIKVEREHLTIIGKRNGVYYG